MLQMSLPSQLVTDPLLTEVGYTLRPPLLALTYDQKNVGVIGYHFFCPLKKGPVAIRNQFLTPF